MEHPLQRLWNKPERLVIGFMSGTSADGVDAALVRISGYGVETRLTQLAFCFTPFDEATRAEVLRLAGGGSAAAADFCRINFHLGQLSCEAGDALCRQAEADKDFATANKLVWFVDEQVEEEQNAQDIIDSLKMVDDSKRALYMIDKELAARAYTAPSIAGA